MRNELERSINEFEGGNITPLQFLYWLKLQRKTAEDELKLIKEAEKEYFDQLAEAAKEQNTYKNAVFTYKPGGSTYNWAGVEEVVEAEKKLKALKARSLAALKMADKGTVAIDEETGEIIATPIRKHSADSISVKFN